jgi:hypothetical protein
MAFSIFQPQSQFLGAAGRFAERVGTAFNLPELGISEGLSGGPTEFTGQTPQTRAANITPDITRIQGPQPAPGSTRGVLPNREQSVAQPTQQDGGSSNPSNDLINALVNKGYNITDATNAANTNYDALAREYLGQNQGPSQEDLQRQVDEIYGLGEAEYARQEQRAREELPNQLGIAEAPFNALQPRLAETLAAGQERIGIGQAETGRQEQNALASARSLFNELKQASQQRFGGAGSAAQAASEIQGRELQRNLGQTRQTAGANRAQLESEMRNLETEFQAQTTQLETQKQASLQQAQMDFRAQLDAINSGRSQLAQNKSIAKLDVLRELRSRAQQIEDQTRQMTMQLQANAVQARQQLQTQLLSYQAEAGKDISLQTQLPPEFSVFGGGSAQGSATPTGFLGQAQPRREDIFA